MQKIFDIDSNVLQNVWTVPSYESSERIRHSTRGLESPFVEIQNIAEVVSGKYMPRYSKQGVPYLRVDNIRSQIANLSAGDVAFISESDVLEIPRNNCVFPKDVLIARTATLGKAVLAPPSFNGYALSQHVTAIRTRDNSPVLPSVLSLFLNSELGKSQLIGKGSGSTRLELTHEALKSIKVPIFSIDIQKRLDDSLYTLISEYYSKISNVRELIKKTDDLLNISSEMPSNRVFSVSADELDDLWTPNRYLPFITDLLHSISSNFSCSKLGDIAEIERGKGTRVSEYQKNGIPFLRTSSLINNSFDPFPDHYADFSTFEKFNQKIQNGDLLYSMEGKIGQVVLLSEKHQVVFKNHIELIRFMDIPSNFSIEEFSGWMYLVLCSGLGKIQCLKHTVVQATIPGLASRLRDFVVPVASENRHINEQFKQLGKQAYVNLIKILDISQNLRDLQTDFELLFQ